MKTFWKYFLIVVLLLLGLVCVGVLYLFFVPGSNLFNITYVSKNEKITSKSYEKASVEKIELNSNSYDIKVVPSNGQKISLKVLNKTFGFALVQNSTLKLDEKLYESVLTFNVTEPYGATTKMDSIIELRLPKDKAFSLTLNNNDALVTVDNKDIKIDNLIYKSSNGRLNLTEGNISGTIAVDTTNSNVVIENSFKTNSNNVNIKSKSGLFSSKSPLGEVTVSSTERCVVRLSECSKFIEKVKTAGGTVELKKVGTIEIDSADTVVKINEVSTSSDITLSKSGSVKIEKINTGATSYVTTASGNIDITTALAPCYLETTTTGKITVQNAYSYTKAESISGDIYIKYADDADSYNTDLKARAVNITSVSGNVRAYNVEHINLSIQDGSADVTMRNVYGSTDDKNTITATKSGSVNLVVNESSLYQLITSSTSGNVTVNVAGMDNSPSGGYTEKTEQTNNVNYKDYASKGFTSGSVVLEVRTTTGSLTIKDYSLIEF